MIKSDAQQPKGRFGSPAIEQYYVIFIVDPRIAGCDEYIEQNQLLRYL